MPFFIKKLLTALIVPPLSLVWLALLGILLSLKHKKLGGTVAILSLVSVLMLSMPFVSSRLVAWVQTDEALNKGNNDARVIVILGCGVAPYAPEYGGPTVNACTLERLRYGAKLFDRTGLPILVSGGDTLGMGISEAKAMKEVLEEDFLTPVRWVEDRSRDTLENARFSYEILRKAGQTKIYLITHAWHMRQAGEAFRRFGFEVIPAPTVFARPKRPGGYSLLPTATGFKESYIALKEVIGLWWYSLVLPKVSD